MKALILVLLTMSLETAFAAKYNCEAHTGDVAELIIKKNETHWYEQTTSASSNGNYLGIEEAPYSDMQGYSLFHLYNYYTTYDSRFILAISPQIRTNQISGEVHIYFDNDDHISELVSYKCSLIQATE